MAESFWQIDSVLNPLRAMNRYKKSKLYETSLSFRLLGFFYLFAGNLDNPANKDFQESRNQIGIFDLITLGIFYLLESFFRGNYMPNRTAQFFMAFFFTFILPIVPLLTLIRYVIAFIPTLLLSPFIAVDFFLDKPQKAQKIENFDEEYSLEEEEDHLENFDYETIIKLVDAKHKYTNAKVTTYHDSNQEEWNSFSERVVDELAEYIATESPDEISLLKLYLILRERRSEIAIRLGHGQKDGDRTTHAFGKLRGIDKLPYKSYFPSEAITAPWWNHKGRWNKFYKLVATELRPKIEDPLFFEKVRSKIGNYRYPPKATENDFKITILYNSVKKNTPSLQQIFFTYPNISDQRTAENNFSKIDPYLKKILNWQKDEINEQNINLFLEDLGKLAYHLFRCLPTYFGNSSEVNWLIRGLAKAKGVVIGRQQENKKDLPLDFQAFSTFSDEEYGRWFAKHAYEAMYFHSTSAVFSHKKSDYEFYYPSNVNTENVKVEISSSSKESILNEYQDSSPGLYRFFSQEVNQTNNQTESSPTPK